MIGKNLATALLGPYASSTKYTVTRHHAKTAEKIQKYAAAFMPVCTELPYAKRQQAIVEPMARKVSTAQRIMSRAVAASAPDQVKKVRTMNQEASSGKWMSIGWGGRAPVAFVHC